MISKIVGQLTDYKSKPIEIPFFDNQKMTVYFEGLDAENVEAADRTLSYFLSFNDVHKLALSENVYQFALNFYSELVSYHNQISEQQGYVDEEDDFLSHWQYLLDIKNCHEIWQYIQPQKIWVRHYNNDIYLQIECTCNWEIEHGFEMTLKQGKYLTRLNINQGFINDEEEKILAVLDNIQNHN